MRSTRGLKPRAAARLAPKTPLIGTTATLQNTSESKPVLGAIMKLPLRFSTPVWARFLVGRLEKKVPETGLNFTTYMTQEAGVATVPLSPFYRVPPKENRMLRMCFAKDDATLREAGHRIRTWK